MHFKTLNTFYSALIGSIDELATSKETLQDLKNQLLLPDSTLRQSCEGRFTIIWTLMVTFADIFTREYQLRGELYA